MLPTEQMKQYLELLRTIKAEGSYKPAARPNMPGTQSLFGYQFRHDLSTGFPALTTKKLYWKGVVVELLWFLRGGTNIKYLVDNGVNIWNEDAYNYYLKQIGRKADGSFDLGPMSIERFIELIKQNGTQEKSRVEHAGYKLGDCGHQYGKVWRAWEGKRSFMHTDFQQGGRYVSTEIDQIANLISSLKNSPESRRHIVTAIDPAHDSDLALYWCHAMFQFNCRELNLRERFAIYDKIPRYQKASLSSDKFGGDEGERHSDLDDQNIPKYYLDCQLYQRSADVVLGVPFNIASYALLTHIIAKMINMVPGHFVHSFGDVHIYDNHKEAVDEQLNRTYLRLPTLQLNDRLDWKAIGETLAFEKMVFTDFTLENYDPQPAIAAKLSTGLK